jgi:hypothetical protein
MRKTETATLIKALDVVALDLQRYNEWSPENLWLYACTIREGAERLEELENLRLSGG